MSLRGIIINEGKIGLNTTGDGREFGLVANGMAITGKAQLHTAYKLRRPSDAVALGIDAAYDTTNDVRLFRHISEFYRRAGEGKILWLILSPQTSKPADMVSDAKILAIASGKISDMAFAYNPPSGYTDVLVDGINGDIKLGIDALQLFAQWADEQDMPLHTILEGRSISATLSACTDLRGMTAPKVSLVVGQDWDYAETLSTMGKKFADVGTFLGVIASQAWNRNPGEVATQKLTSDVPAVWITGGLSNHQKYNEVFSSLETLNDKGYIFPIRYQGLSGYWWNDGHVCAPITVDADGNMNQHTIYYSHTMDMAKRALRIAFLPELKRPVELVNGKLDQTSVDYYNAIGDMAFMRLAGSDLISDGKTYADKESDLLIDKTLKIQFSVIPTGCVNTIEGTINLKNQ